MLVWDSVLVPYHSHMAISVSWGLLFWDPFMGDPMILDPYSLPLIFENSHTGVLLTPDSGLLNKSHLKVLALRGVHMLLRRLQYGLLEARVTTM